MKWPRRKPPEQRLAESVVRAVDRDLTHGRFELGTRPGRKLVVTSIEAHATGPIYVTLERRGQYYERMRIKVQT